MEEQKVIVGEFENELYAKKKKRELESAGINANILKEDSDVFIIFSEESKGVQLVIPGTQLEEAKKILNTKFY